MDDSFLWSTDVRDVRIFREMIVPMVSACQVLEQLILYVTLIENLIKIYK